MNVLDDSGAFQGIYLCSDRLSHRRCKLEMPFADKALGVLKLNRMQLPVPHSVVLDGRRIWAARNGLHFEELATLISHYFELKTGAKLGCEKPDGDKLLLIVRTGSKKRFSLPPSIAYVGSKSISGLNVVRQKDLKAQLEALEIALGESTITSAFDKCGPKRQLTTVLFEYSKLLVQGEVNADTSIIVQEMKFGDADACSFSGMAYTMNPYTGLFDDYGRYLPNVSGATFARSNSSEKYALSTLATDFPHQYQILRKAMRLLNETYYLPRNIEFVCDRGKLFIVQNTVSRHDIPELVQFSECHKPINSSQVRSDVS